MWPRGILFDWFSFGFCVCRHLTHIIVNLKACCIRNTLWLRYIRIGLAQIQSTQGGSFRQIKKTLEHTKTTFNNWNPLRNVLTRFQIIYYIYTICIYLRRALHLILTGVWRIFSVHIIISIRIGISYDSSNNTPCCVFYNLMCIH